jgi:glutaryl-CoA dehydrogenase (non-decarboxylating)
VDFGLTEEQREAAKMVRSFAEKEVAPTIKEWDRRQEMDPAVLPRMGELGILGLNIPVKYGGQGYDYVSLGLVCEELERVDTTLRVVMSVHMGLCSMALLQWGTEEQKQRFLVPQARGEEYAGFGLTEPGHGSDVANLRATARRDGDDYILNGEKMWISLATKAHNFLVVARTDRDAPKPSAGLTAFMITSAMQDVAVPEAYRIGEEGEGFKIAMSALDGGRYTVASGATGLIRACLEESVEYAREREAFGRPIAEYQLMQQKIAYMSLWYETARLLYIKAGWLKNQGIRNTRETSQAKWYATEHSVKAALEAVQLHGAYGYSDEYNVERYLRNSKGAVIYEGTSEIHQLMQAAYQFGTRKDRPLRCELPAYDEDAWQEGP